MALISGGKDSLFNIAKCLAHGHELVALANLYPPSDGPDELDSFMFQSAGSTAIEALAECLGVPLFRAQMSGCSGHQGLHYTPTEGDEVEDLYRLIEQVKVCASIGRAARKTDSTTIIIMIIRSTDWMDAYVISSITCSSSSSVTYICPIPSIYPSVISEYACIHMYTERASRDQGRGQRSCA